MKALTFLKHRAIALIAMLEHLMVASVRRMGDTAAGGLAGLGALALGIAGVILAVVIGLSILAALFPTYSGSVGNISENVSTADWGDPTANAIGPISAMVVSLGGLFAIVGLVFVSYKMRNSGG